MTQTKSSTRRHYTPEQKYKIVKEHLTTNSTISQTCKKYGISAGNFYRWQDSFFEGALERLKNGKVKATSAELQKIDQLEGENDRFKTVIAEMTHEVITLKKNLGE